MSNLNSVLLEGHLKADPQFSAGVCSFTLKSIRNLKQNNILKQEIAYFDIIVEGKQAEVCKEHLEKGRGIRVIGRLKQERWKDDKGRRSHIYIVAEHVEFKPNFVRRAS
jgi:single-strand DNA-binding protein